MILNVIMILTHSHMVRKFECNFPSNVVHSLVFVQ